MIRLEIKYRFIIFVCMLPLFLSACKSNGTDPFEIFQITDVEFSPKMLHTNYTVKIIPEIEVKDSTYGYYKLRWEIESPGGETFDTTTSNKQLFWTTPDISGVYKFSVQAESGNGKAITREYSLTKEIIPWQPSQVDIFDSGKIVYTAKSNLGSYQMYTINTDGSELQELTSWVEEVYGASWNSDGTQIIFSSFKEARNINAPALWVVDADGQNPSLFKDEDRLPLLGNNARWNRDGDKVVYQHCVICDPSYSSEIFIYDNESEKSLRITDDQVDQFYPEWSPDGNRIVFASGTEEDAYNRDLFISNIDGTGLTRITENANANNPVWNPNGKTIAFSSSENHHLLYSVDINTKQVKTYNPKFSEEWFLKPHGWSPDGSKLLFSGGVRLDNVNSSFFILNVETGGIQKIHTVMESNQGSIIESADWFIPYN